MFSTTDDSGYPIVQVIGGEDDGEIIFCCPEDKDKKGLKKPNPIRHYSCADGVFQHIPNEKIRVLYIPGASGSGKSTYSAKYASCYKKLYPECKIFIFSRLLSDEPFDDLDCIWITLNDDFIKEPLSIDDIEPNSMCIFDDMDQIEDLKLLDALLKFQQQVLELGRHTNIQCIITGHLFLPLNAKLKRRIMNEMQCVTVFPQDCNFKQTHYAMSSYLNLSPQAINYILDSDSRWVTITNRAPKIIFTEHECIFACTMK